MQIKVSPNTTIIGVGANPTLLGMNLFLSNINNVIVRNLTFVDAFDCFPQWDPTDGLAGNFEYATDLFDQSTIARMVGHFETLLSEIVKGPERRIEAISMLSSEERAQLPNSERVYRALRDQILTGALVPLTRLVELQVAQQFAVSRTPVREALKRLIAEGLVVGDSLRGMVVRDVADGAREHHGTRHLADDPDDPLASMTSGALARWQG